MKVIGRNPESDPSPESIPGAPNTICGTYVMTGCEKPIHGACECCEEHCQCQKAAVAALDDALSRCEVLGGEGFQRVPEHLLDGLRERIEELEADVEHRRIELEKANSRISEGFKPMIMRQQQKISELIAERDRRDSCNCVCHNPMSSAIGCVHCAPAIVERRCIADLTAERDAARAAARELWQALNEAGSTWQHHSHHNYSELLAKHAELVKEEVG